MRQSAARSVNGCVIVYIVLMWKQTSRVAAAAAAAAVEIPVLQRAPLACFMCVNMLYWAILHIHFKQLRVSPVQKSDYTQCYWSVDVHEENVITTGQSVVFLWNSQRGIFLLYISVEHQARFKNRKSNLTCLPSRCIISYQIIKVRRWINQFTMTEQ